MTIVRFAGVDPGLVHTGVVTVQLDNHERKVRTTTHVVLGDDPDAVAQSLDGFTGEIFVERYEDRGTVFGTHADMRKMESALMTALGRRRATLLSNTGVKKVITDPMLDAFGLLHVQSTNHRDLQAAARIGIQGALRVPEYNSVIYQYLIDSLAGHSWARS